MSVVACFTLLALSVVAAFGQTKTSDDTRPKPWTHGPYDKLMPPAPKPSAVPFVIIEKPRTESNQPPRMLIYHGTRAEEADSTNTNRLAPPTLRLQSK